MNAQLLEGPEDLERRPLHPAELIDPDPQSDEVVLDIHACAVCRTDLQIVEGDLEPRRLPIVPGHQVVGRIAAVGSDVDGAEVGRRVGVGWLAGTCGECRFCMSERENLCERATFTGWDRNGGYAERMTARADFVLPLPDNLPDQDLAPMLCGGVIGYRALKVSGVQPGGRLGLFGFGSSAFLAIQVARHWNCEVYVATRSEREQERAISVGAAWAGTYAEPMPEALDAAITFAPVGDVVIAALRALDRGGVVAINAIHLDRVPEFPYEMLWWERQIRSVANYTRADAREFLELAAAIPIRTLAQPYPLDQANEALTDLKRGAVDGTAVLTMGQ